MGLYPTVYAVHCGLWKAVAAVNAESTGVKLVQLRREERQPTCLSIPNVFLRIIAL